MDSTLLPLFSLGEILIRLGQTLQTGCLHVFTQRESANVFFRDGLIVAAGRGLFEGEEVVKQVLEWKDARMVWQPNETAPSSLKAFQMNIVEALQPQAAPPQKPEIVKKEGKTRRSPASAPITTPTARPVVFIPANPTASAPLPARPSTKLPALSPVTEGSPVQLTATKNISLTAQARSSQEEALLQKHKMSLVSVEDPKQRIKITRASSLIGRNPACDIAINHSSVSRQHCLLHLTERGIHLKDLDTTNGTKVNGISLTEGYVNPGDKLTIGHETYTLEKE